MSIIHTLASCTDAPEWYYTMGDHNGENQRLGPVSATALVALVADAGSGKNTVTTL
jgi:hypothetical protein